MLPRRGGGRLGSSAWVRREVKSKRRAHAATLPIDGEAISDNKVTSACKRRARPTRRFAWSLTTCEFGVGKRAVTVASLTTCEFGAGREGSQVRESAALRGGIEVRIRART